MASIFTMIRDGDIPGSFVWRDDVCFAILSINPGSPGHALVIPNEEIDHWIDLDAGVASHLLGVAQTIGKAQMAAFQPSRIGLMIVGEEVPHVHLHTIPMHTLANMDLGQAARRTAAPEELAANAARILDELRAQGVEPGV